MHGNLLEILPEITKIIEPYGNTNADYIFDKIQLRVVKLDQIQKQRLRPELKKYVSLLRFKKLNDEETGIILIGISKIGLRELCTKLQHVKLRIDEVEIACDIAYYEDAHTEETYFPVGDELVLRIGKILTSNFGLDYKQPKSSPEPKIDKGVHTLYFNFSSTFKFVIYARLSKRKKVPVIHMEFRIFGYSNIKSKIGVCSLSALRKLNLQNIFWQLYSDKISCASSEIDYLKVGNFFIGQHCNTKLIECKSIRGVYRAKYKSRAYVEWCGWQVCRVYDLETPFDVRDYCLSLKDSEYSIPQRLGNSPSIKNKNYFAVKS